MYRYSCSCRACLEPGKKVCGESSRFIFQWYSDKENSKPGTERRPYGERGVCADFSHMIDIIVNDNPYDNLPQRLVDFETQEKQYPEILGIVERAVCLRTNPEALELFLEQGREALRNIPGLKGIVE